MAGLQQAIKRVEARNQPPSLLRNPLAVRGATAVVPIGYSGGDHVGSGTVADIVSDALPGANDKTGAVVENISKAIGVVPRHH